MKVFTFTFLIAVFLVNTFTIAAWAKPCVNANSSEMSQISGDISHNAGNMPCEDMQQNENQRYIKHCDGVCFCMHMSSSQTSIIGASSQFQMPFDMKLGHDFINDAVASLSYSPDKRPPKA